MQQTRHLAKSIFSKHSMSSNSRRRPLPATMARSGPASYLLDPDGYIIATPDLILPEPWEMRQSGTFAGRFYFYNKKTQKSEWSLAPSILNCDWISTAKADPIVTLPLLKPTAQALSQTEARHIPIFNGSFSSSKVRATSAASVVRSRYAHSKSLTPMTNTTAGTSAASGASFDSGMKKAASSTSLSAMRRGKQERPSFVSSGTSSSSSSSSSSRLSPFSTARTGTTGRAYAAADSATTAASATTITATAAAAAAAAAATAVGTKSRRQQLLAGGSFDSNKGGSASPSGSFSIAERQQQQQQQQQQQSPFVASSSQPPPYRVVGGLGQGGFAVVVAAEYTGRQASSPSSSSASDSSLVPPRRVALKVVSKDKVQRRRDREGLKLELKIMQEEASAALPSPWLMWCHASFETDFDLFFVLDLVSGGDLFFHLIQRIRRTGLGLEESEAVVLVAEVVLAVTHLHDRGYLHRDIKIENVMLDSKGHVKLVDFGLACEFPATNSSNSSNGGGNSSSSGMQTTSFLVEKRAMNPTGSLIYMSPEMLGEKVGGRFTDWWAVGVLAHELMTGRTPWSSLKDKKVIKQEIKTLKVAPPPRLSQPAGQLVCALLRHDYNARLGSRRDGEIQEAAFFKTIDWDLTNRQQAPPALLHFRNEGGGGQRGGGGGGGGHTGTTTTNKVLVTEKDQDAALKEYLKRAARHRHSSSERDKGGAGAGGGGSGGESKTCSKVWYLGLDTVAAPPEFVPGAAWFLAISGD